MKKPPKKTDVKPETKLQITKKGIMEVEVKADKPKNRKKYIRIPDTESDATFKDIGERVFKKELKWSYFAIENLVGVHYYEIINREI